jgi:hypothetical protein
MTATGEIVDGKPHIHAVMAVQGDRTIGGHLYKAHLGISFARATHRDRIAENGRIFDFELTGEELKQLNALDRTGGTGSALENKWW